MSQVFGLPIVLPICHTPCQVVSCMSISELARGADRLSCAVMWLYTGVYGPDLTQCHVLSVAKTSVSVVYVTCVVYIAGMIELLLVLLPLFTSLGWWAHVIYAGRAARLHSKVDAARQYWKSKYHDAIAQRNMERRRVKRWRKKYADGKRMT